MEIPRGPAGATMDMPSAHDLDPTANQTGGQKSMSTKRKQEADLAAEEMAAEQVFADPAPFLDPASQPDPTAYEGQDQNISAEPFGVFAAAESEPTPPVTGPLIYLGPNIPGGRL